MLKTNLFGVYLFTLGIIIAFQTLGVVLVAETYSPGIIHRLANEIRGIPQIK